MTDVARNLIDHLRPLRRALTRLEVCFVAQLGRSPVSVVARTPVLVLETTGWRTGSRRSTVVAYLRLDDADLVVVGGASGQRRIPDWVANLRADPTVLVTVDRRRRRMQAEELSGSERAARWEEARRVWPRVEVYERRAGRPVPVFRLRETSVAQL